MGAFIVPILFKMEPYVMSVEGVIEQLDMEFGLDKEMNVMEKKGPRTMKR